MMDERVEEAVRQHKQKVEWHQTESPTETVESTTTTEKNRISTPKRTWKSVAIRDWCFLIGIYLEIKVAGQHRQTESYRSAKIKIFIVIWQLRIASQSFHCKASKIVITKKEPAKYPNAWHNRDVFGFPNSQPIGKELSTSARAIYRHVTILTFPRSH